MEPGPRIEETGGSEDEVVLTSGGFVRGRISEMTPGESVVIQPSGGGEAREIAWEEIDVIRRATGEPATTELPPGTKVEFLPAVHIDFELLKNKPVTLYEITGEAVAVGSGGSAVAIGFRPVCHSPCARRVGIDPAASYFVAGNGVTGSKHFTIPDKDRVTLQVKPGSKVMWGSGIVTEAFGISAVITGIILFAVGASESGDSRKALFAAGGGTLGAGVVMVGAGVPLILFGRTEVKVKS